VSIKAGISSDDELLPAMHARCHWCVGYMQASWDQVKRDVRKHAVPQLQKAMMSTKEFTKKLQSHPQVWTADACQDALPL
jgi:hypothetical protein